ncbi:16S rRNA (uracil(1498)-N(3))-methyltransferase [Microbacterium caowuchunii]|uniref:Ribosomal RNA small subunit methyltransferase E n=1 Tax=Microbacterium caowuchunii TaxID=2614638 RepID=A0A5N0TPD8_9MICO|nr:16S rRNA (uracil(1498)-N(3))-methyltransferase [Microbacterium caowuchunii]KAA9135776.1 16S rRNA (uracil(1498)-N(3))-methyltransferase [Microbacterium caowuchunii]
MALHFLVEDAAEVAEGYLVVLTGAEAHHAATVRRVRVGEQVTVGDGRGLWAEGVVEAAAPREVSVRVTARREVPARTPRLVLVQALAKGDRDELAVQAATELGVDAIVPWQAARSVSRWDAAKAEKGRTRWAGIVREAAKQAHRAWIPEVETVASTAQIAARAVASVVLVLEPTASERLSDRVRALPPTGDAEILLVVGPEGGIDPREIAEFTAAGAFPVRLGESVLRTSTAGPAALAAVEVCLGRW